MDTTYVVTIKISAQRQTLSSIRKIIFSGESTRAQARETGLLKPAVHTRNEAQATPVSNWEITEVQGTHLAKVKSVRKSNCLDFPSGHEGNNVKSQ